MKKILLVLLLSVVFALSGCGGGGSQGRIRYESPIRPIWVITITSSASPASRPLAAIDLTAMATVTMTIRIALQTIRMCGSIAAVARPVAATATFPPRSASQFTDRFFGRIV